MSFELSGLTAFTDEHKMDLIKESILKGRTVDLVTVQPGIKNSATINKISTSLILQAGACGWNASGTTSLTQRAITVSDIKINESICVNTLEDYYTSVMMNPGSYNESIPFEQIYSENKRDNIQAVIEDLIWRGDTDTGSGNLALADGLIKLFDADALLSPPVATTDTYTAATIATPSNAVDIIDAMVADVPENIIDADDLHIFCSYSFYRIYSKQLRDANLFHYTGAEDQGLEFSQMVPGTNVRLVAVKGLTGQDRLVLTQASNIVVGTDLLSDGEDFSIFYSKDNDEVRFLSKWKLGVNVAFLENVVYYQGV